MPTRFITVAVAFALTAMAGGAPSEARAQARAAQSYAVPPEPYGEPPIPPHSEGEPVTTPGGGYCYGSAHPVDTRAAAGPPWHESAGPHTHYYAPFDLRLYAFRDGCYYFIGDPQDFGYSGAVYSYYGAHPVLDTYGGGWCFMIGGHHHPWGPWSAHFTVIGPWYYWHGPYDDPFFWSYWPYYSFYYRSYYPRYYGDGRWRRGRDVHVAPPISRVPLPSAGARGGTWRATPPTSGAGAAPGVARPISPYGAVPPWGGTLSGNPGARGAPTPVPPESVAPSPGGVRTGVRPIGGGHHPAPSSGGGGGIVRGWQR